MPDQQDATVDAEQESTAGADQSGGQGEGGGGQQQEGQQVEGAEQLGDAGKQALDRMKAERNATRDELRDAKTALALLQQEKADRDRSAEELVVEQARRNADAAATAKVNARILKAEIKSAAAGKVVDTDVALRLIDLDKIAVSDDGEPDIDAIADAISALLEKHPYLAPPVGTKFVASDAGQAKRGQEGPKQLSREELKTMKPQEILDARKNGQMDRLLKG